MNVRTLIYTAILLLVAIVLATAQQTNSKESWKFAVSGDSRNCGDVIMPAIAACAANDRAAFYWHLGDLRATHSVDEDMQQIAKLKNRQITNAEYQAQVWDDFIENQIAPFGKLPFYVGIGNHETVALKTREQFVAQFADWLNAPVLQEQRLQDNRKWRAQGMIDDREKDRNSHQLKTYYHWKQGVVDFVYLDNATGDQFDAEQMRWIDRVMKSDGADDSVRTVVVGMHEALPFSISCDHSMNETGNEERSGLKVYRTLLDLQNKSQKHVYVLASHSHYFMDGIYNTKYWHENGGVLPGWIIGTAGALRYPLPINKTDATASAEGVYGYLLGTVHDDGKVDFAFREVKEDHIPVEIKRRYTPEFVHDGCFVGNRRLERAPMPDFCAAVASPVGTTGNTKAAQ